MTIAYFDCFAGIAGDMTLAALIDCGVPLEKLREGLASLPVEGWHIDAQPVLKNGIHAVSVSVALHGETDEEEFRRQMAETNRQETAHNHSHSHGEETHSHHDSTHEHEHHHEHSHDEPTRHSSLVTRHAHGRSMREIRAIIEASELSEKVKELSLKIFGEIARAEAKIHHAAPDDVHFHEIGGVDSLIDICGVAWCLDFLKIEKIYSSPLPHSTGHVHCAHGIMPVPAPATLEMLRGAPFFPSGLEGETITPTGAGILAALGEGFGSPPAFSPRLIGVGAGKKDWRDRPNILRVIVGETARDNENGAPSSTRLAGLQRQRLQLLETNVDDMNPEMWDHVLERLFAVGSLDAWLQPVQMKKNRPATTLCVLCEDDTRDAVLTTILRETTTLGVRMRETERWSLPRASQSVPTPWGEVRVKVARWDEAEIERAAPEYDDVSRLARQHNVAAREIYQFAQNAFRH